MTEKIKQIWKDPVFSKVISIGIIGLITMIYNLVYSIIENTSFRNEFMKFWTLKIELWHFAILILSYVGVHPFCSSQARTRTRRCMVLSPTSQPP